MTVTPHVVAEPARTLLRSRRGRHRAARAGFVPAVGSPWDEWSTMRLPVVPGPLDPVTDVIGLPVPAVHAPAVRPLVTLTPRGVAVPAPRSAAEGPVAARPVAVGAGAR